MKQKDHTHSLGLAKKIANSCNGRDSVVEYGKFQTTSEFLNDILNKVKESSIRIGNGGWYFNIRFNNANEKIDNGVFYSMNPLSKTDVSIKLDFNASWSEKKFNVSPQLRVSNFEGFNYATFYPFIYKGTLCITWDHDLWASKKAEEDGLQFNFDKSVDTSIVFVKIAEWVDKIGINNLKDIACVLTKKHNPTSCNQGFISTKDNTIYTYRSKPWWNENEPCVYIEDENEFAPSQISSAYCTHSTYFLEKVEQFELKEPSDEEIKKD
jgi:hypothetical protein